MNTVLTFFSLLLSCYFLLRIFRTSGITEYILFFYSTFVSHIVILGFILSYFKHLNEIRYWALTGMISAILSTFLFTITDRPYNKPPRGLLSLGYRVVITRFSFSIIKNSIIAVKGWYLNGLSHFERWLLTLMFSTVLTLGVLNLTVIIFTAPHNWDSMAVHLARMAYYLQNNSLTYFDANHWAQVTHPKIQPILLIFTYLISGRNENLTQLVQFFSYWIAICCLYAISLKAGNSKNQSIFAALIGSLLVNWLMESTTTQNDMILTAFLGITTYSLISFKKTRGYKYLIFAAIGIGLSIGTKEASILPLVSIGLIALFALISVNIRSFIRNLWIFTALTIVSVSIFALPSGYLEVFRKFGGSYISGFSFIGEPFPSIAINGTKNLIRFGFDFLSLDGLPAMSNINDIQTYLRTPFVNLVDSLGIALETPIASARPFSYSRNPYSHEDVSFWGVLGFGLIWIAVFIVVFSSGKTKENKILAYAALLFLFLQSYSGPYDPYRGRYFTNCAIFAVPIIGLLLQTKNKIGRLYIFLIVTLGCLFALSAVVFRSNRALISLDYKDLHTTSVFSMDRLTQLTRNNPGMEEPLKTFEKMVPTTAWVAVFLNPDSYEYPLFGEGLSRTILPINSFEKKRLPISMNADYLLYTANGYPCPSSEDVSLGGDWYLRTLTEINRACP